MTVFFLIDTKFFVSFSCIFKKKPYLCFVFKTLFIMKNYLILLKNSNTNAEYSMVLTGSFDLVFKMVKSVLREFSPEARKFVYIKSISEL